MEGDETIDSTLSTTLSEIQSRGAEPSSGVSPPSPASTPAATTPQVNEWDNLPKAWKQDMSKHWGQLSPDVRKYVHEREKQALEGIMQYKQIADPWTKTLEPYQQVFQHYGVQPQEAFKRLADAHLILLYGTPQQKQVVAHQLVRDYNLMQFLQQGQQPQVDFSPFQRRLDALEASFTSEREAKTLQDVEAFLNNPENEYAKEVLQDMIDLVKAGVATDLRSAYDAAVLRNPEIRQKMIQKEAAKIASPQVSAPTNVKSSGVPAAPTGQVTGSIDDTLKSVYKQIVNR